MAQPGDVRKHSAGWQEIIAHVDDKGQPTGGYLVPPGNDDMVEDVVAFVREEEVLKRKAEEEETLRDMAIRLGAAIGMGPGEVFERLIYALQADSLFNQRKRVQAMKNWWWDKAMLPIYEKILDGLPPEEEGVEEYKMIFCPGCGVEQKMRIGVFTGFSCDCGWTAHVSIGMRKEGNPQAEMQAWKPLDESKG